MIGHWFPSSPAALLLGQGQNRLRDAQNTQVYFLVSSRFQFDVEMGGDGGDGRSSDRGD